MAFHVSLHPQAGLLRDAQTQHHESRISHTFTPASASWQVFQHPQRKLPQQWARPQIRSVRMTIRQDYLRSTTCTYQIRAVRLPEIHVSNSIGRYGRLATAKRGQIVVLVPLEYPVPLESRLFSGSTRDIMKDKRGGGFCRDVYITGVQYPNCTEVTQYCGTMPAFEMLSCEK